MREEYVFVNSYHCVRRRNGSEEQFKFGARNSETRMDKPTDGGQRTARQEVTCFTCGNTMLETAGKIAAEIRWNW